MLIWKYLSFLLLIVCFDLTAQNVVDVSWTSIKVQHKLNKKTNIAVAPIMRHNLTETDYQNTSLDLAVGHKINGSWSLQLTERTWFLPKNQYRQFLWVDLNYHFDIKEISTKSGIRVHKAFDIKERVDPDFLRWKTAFTLTKFAKIKPIIAIEPWLRMNRKSSFQRMRYELGARGVFSKSMDLLFMYRRQNSINQEIKNRTNMFVLTFNIKI